MNGSTRRAVTITAVVAALVGAGVSFAVAAIPAPDGTITACVKGMGEYFPNSGVCKKGHKTVKWNVQGPPGAAGSDASINGVAAGGDLQGTYPDPTLKSGSVSSQDVLNGSLTVGDLVKEDITHDVDLGLIGHGACAEFFIPVTTSAANPVALVNPPGNFYNDPGLVFNWNVGVNQFDPVAVHVCNVSAQDIDPPNGGWRAILFAG